jgi:hypothetical protein
MIDISAFAVLVLFRVYMGLPTAALYSSSHDECTYVITLVRILLLTDLLSLSGPRRLTNFRNKLSFYGELLAPLPTTKLEDHHLSTVRYCLFSIFAATLHIWRVSKMWHSSDIWERLLTNQNLIQEEIKRRLNSGKACYHSVQNLLSSRLPSKNVKITMYKTIILHVQNLVSNIKGGS